MRTLEEIVLAPKDRRAIQAAARVLRERFPVDQVILYGSKARGSDDPESDIDLLLLTRRPLTWPEQRQVTKALFPLQLRYNVVLSPLDVSRAEWTTGLYQALPLRDEVERDGVAV